MTNSPNLNDDNYLPPLAGVRFLSKTVSILSIALIFLLLWILFAGVDEVAKARGEVVPKGLIYEYESEAGGTIKNIYVQEGQVVEAGQVLVELDKKLIQEELEKEIAHQQNLRAEVARLTAFVENTPIDFGDYPVAEYYKKQQQSVLEADRALMKADISILKEELNVAQAELDAVNIEIPTLKKQIERAKKAREMIEKGKKQQIVSVIRFLDFMQTESQYYRQLSGLEGKALTTKAKIEEIKNKIKELPVKRYAEALDERATIIKELIEKDHVVARLTKQFSDAKIVTPIKGIVFSLTNHNPGAVIGPGEVVAKIVPMDDQMVIEAKLNPKDVGYVTDKQPARIKIDTYDFSRYGVLQGEVERISASTFTTRQGETYYKVYIKLDKTYFGDKPEQYKILPEMTAEADIITGRKTIFQYLWKPIYTLTTTAFSER